MKNPIKIRVAITALVLVYVLALLGGLETLCYSAGGWKRSSLESYARQRVIEYTNNDSVNNWNNGGMAVVVYDAQGEFQDFFRANGDPFVVEFVLRSEEYIPKVLSGDTTMKLYPFVKGYSKLGYTSYLYIGLPMRVNGEITGAFFWIKELTDLSETLLAYTVVITGFFAAIIVVVIVYLRLQNKYERMQSAYIDNITHEMKAPIASIRALTEALTDKPNRTDSERSAYYGMIIGEANRQEKMILNVLTLAKLQSAPVTPLRGRIPASDIFDPICEKHGALCELLGVEFRVADSIRSLPRLSTDPQTINQVLEIVLSNARKFVGEDGVISLSATVHRRHVTICVADNGVGIPKKDLPYVFERFYRGSQRCNDTGSGLGLAIARETLAALKEKIWASSEENKGTSIYFTIARG